MARLLRCVSKTKHESNDETTTRTPYAHTNVTNSKIARLGISQTCVDIAINVLLTVYSLKMISENFRLNIHVACGYVKTELHLMTSSNRHWLRPCRHGSCCVAPTKTTQVDSKITFREFVKSCFGLVREHENLSDGENCQRLMFCTRSVSASCPFNIYVD